MENKPETSEEVLKFRKELMDLVTESEATKGELVDELLAGVASCLVLFKCASFGHACERLKTHMDISGQVLAIRENNPFGYPPAIIDA